MEDMMPWVSSIMVALITGLLSYAGVIRTSRLTHDATIQEVKSEQEKNAAVIGQQINGIKSDIKRLEEKQDKHNSLIERTFKLEQRVDDLAKQM